MRLKKSFRLWFYTRSGYQIYFAFLLTGINTLTVTYFLAIDNAPFLKILFPTFPIYVAFFMLVGLPIVALVGYVHFRKVPGFESQISVNTENNPYVYKLPPGYWLQVIMPYFLAQSKLLTKFSKNEKVTDEELKTISNLQEKMEHLNKGGYVGIGKNRSFKDSDISIDK